MSDKTKVIGTLIALVIILLGLHVKYMFHDEITGTIKDKYEKRAGKQDDFYIVIEDKDGGREVLKNSDLWLKGKFNSADVQASVEVGDAVTVKTVGLRLPVLSLYKIVEAIEPAGETS